MAHELGFLLIKRFFKELKDLASKYLLESLDGKKIAVFAMQPLGSLFIQSTSRYSEVNVGMIQQVLPPGVGHSYKANLST